MPGFNRPRFRRKDPRDYLAGVDAYVGKLAVTLRAYAVSAKTTRLAKAPSDAAIRSATVNLQRAYIELAWLISQPGKHLTDAVAELELCIDDLELLVSRCVTAEEVS